MCPYKRILGNLFRVLGIPQELVYHRKNTVPITGYHLVKRGSVAVLETVYEETVQRHFICLGRHTVFHALTGIFVNCSH